MPRTDDLRIREMKELLPPSHLIRELSCSEKAATTAADARNALHRILHGQDDRLMVVIGPCSIHDTKAAMEYANRLVKERERFIGELISPPKDDPNVQRSLGQFRAELHDRLLAGIYPFVFVILAFAFLGPPRTTRQGRNFAITSLVLIVLIVRIGGYACSTIAVTRPDAIIVQYAMLLTIAALSIWMIVKGVVVEPPANLTGGIARLRERLSSVRLPSLRR